jgi:hypothetical protein
VRAAAELAREGVLVVGLAGVEVDAPARAFLNDTVPVVVRLERSGVAGDSSSYLFVFDHTQFVDLCDCAASFITPAMPALQAIHHKHHLPLILNQK